MHDAAAFFVDLLATVAANNGVPVTVFSDSLDDAVTDSAGNVISRIVVFAEGSAPVAPTYADDGNCSLTNISVVTLAASRREAYRLSKAAHDVLSADYRITSAQGSGVYAYQNNEHSILQRYDYLEVN